MITDANVSSMSVRRTSLASISSFRLLRSCNADETNISDLPQWICIYPDDLEGSALAVRESFGLALCSTLGLPTARIAWASFSPFPGAFEGEVSGYFPTYPGGGKVYPYQLLPKGWIHKVANRELFLKMLLVDLWAGQSNGRKAVYYAASEDTLLMNFFDFTGMFHFDGSVDDFSLSKARYSTPEIYPLWDTDRCLSIWQEQIAGIDRDRLTSLIDELPSFLRNTCLCNEIISGLLARQEPLLVWLKSEGASFLRKCQRF